MAHLRTLLTITLVLLAPQLLHAQLVRYSAAAFDPVTGLELKTVDANDEFDLIVYVEDLRPDPLGAFSAFVDVTWNPTLLDPDTPDHTHGFYSQGVNGIVSNGAYAGNDGSLSFGLYDEAGGIGGLTPPGGGPVELFRIPFTATAGIGDTPIAISLNPADNLIHQPTLVYLGPTRALEPSEMEFVGIVLNDTAPGLADPQDAGQAVAEFGEFNNLSESRFTWANSPSTQEEIVARIHEWQANFGQNSSMGDLVPFDLNPLQTRQLQIDTAYYREPVAFAVPEPSSAMLLLTIVLGWRSWTTSSKRTVW